MLAISTTSLKVNLRPVELAVPFVHDFAIAQRLK